MTSSQGEPVSEVIRPPGPYAAASTAVASRIPDLRGKTVGELWDSSNPNRPLQVFVKPEWIGVLVMPSSPRGGAPRSLRRCPFR